MSERDYESIWGRSAANASPMDNAVESSTSGSSKRKERRKQKMMQNPSKATKQGGQGDQDGSENYHNQDPEDPFEKSSSSVKRLAQAPSTESFASTKALYQSALKREDSSRSLSSDPLTKSLGEQFRYENEVEDWFRLMQLNNTTKPGLSEMKRKVQRKRDIKRNLAGISICIAGVLALLMFSIFVHAKRTSPGPSSDLSPTEQSHEEAVSVSMTKDSSLVSYMEDKDFENGYILSTEEETDSLEVPQEDQTTDVPFTIDGASNTTSPYEEDSPPSEEESINTTTNDESKSSTVLSVCYGSKPAFGRATSLADVSEECLTLCQSKICCWDPMSQPCADHPLTDECSKSAQEYLHEVCSFLTDLLDNEDYSLVDVPPADEQDLARHCDNSDATDGYLECKRLCMMAECCWKEDWSDEPCSSEDMCFPYVQHCSILNDP